MINCNVVLSGGGARGFAHLGVLKALREQNVSFSAISATSSGAFIGAFLCHGYSLEETEKICHEALPLTRLNFHFTQGLLSIESVNTIFDKYLRHKTFEELQYPFFVSVTDLNTGKQTILNKGNIKEAVIASASIPIIFPPVVINGVPYADGGISGNLPVEPFIGSKLKTIAVHVNPIEAYNPKLNIMRQFERTLHLALHENVQREIEHTDLLIEPKGLLTYGLFDTKEIDEIIKIGYNYVKQNVNVKEVLPLS